MAKKKINWQAVLTLVLVVGLLCYFAFQVYRSFFTGVDTEMAVVHSVYDSIDAQGLIYRTESMVKQPKNGYPYFLVENGTRVARNSVIASVYSDSNSGHIGEQIQEIDELIDAYSAINQDASSGVVDTSYQTFEAIERMIRNTDSGCLTGVDDVQFEMLSLLSKEQIVNTKKKIDFSSKISALKKEKAKLKSAYRSPKSSVKAAVAGYFSNEVDGFESLLDTDDLGSLTVEKLNENMKKDVKPSDSVCGKIVSGYEWFVACVVPDSYYSVLKKGTNLSLRMSYVLDEAVPATVHFSPRKDGEGNMVVVFRCDYMSPELAIVRKEPVQIQLVEYTGLKVPKRAIVIDKDGEAGVYIRSGNVVSFRKIKQLFSEPADYVICEEVNESGYLRMYDDIIVGGKELYDGKIIN